MHKLGFVLAVIAALAACKKKSEQQPTPAPEPGSAGPGSAPPPLPPAVDAAPPPWDGKTPLSIKEGFSTPESVLYDAEGDVYLVANINGTPLEVDDNGFIARVSPDGKVVDPKWIDGTKDTVKLDAPKGMAISGGVLWVADITVVRQFDAKTGEPKGEVKIDGATFLNDVAAGVDGGVYVTDSGLDAKFEPTGTDAVYQIAKDGKVKPVIKNKDLGRPNGVIAGADGTLTVATFGTGEVYTVAKGKKGKPEKLPKGQADGVVALEGGDLLISSWEGSAVFRGRLGGEWKPVVENVKSPADIGFDTKRKRILIPLFQENVVILHPYE